VRNIERECEKKIKGQMRDGELERDREERITETEREREIE
jgi:hypothetical protein